MDGKYGTHKVYIQKMDWFSGIWKAKINEGFIFNVKIIEQHMLFMFSRITVFTMSLFSFTQEIRPFTKFFLPFAHFI